MQAFYQVAFQAFWQTNQQGRVATPQKASGAGQINNRCTQGFSGAGGLFDILFLYHGHDQ
jgi:hypothetical protein